MSKPVVLLIADDPSSMGFLCRSLEGDYGVATATNDDVAIRRFADIRPSAVVLSAAEPDQAVAIRHLDPRIPIAYLCLGSSEDKAIRALRVGINDYFKEPWNLTEIRDSLRLWITVPKGLPIDQEDFIGSSPVMRGLLRKINQIAKATSTVLVLGGTGTGKERVAEMLHRRGHHADGPYVAVNCAAVPDDLLVSELFGFERGAFTGANASYPGKVRMAAGGTLFLDEVGDMSLVSQSKMLRFLENKEVSPLRSSGATRVDVRVIAATNKDLQEEVAAKRFRQDLFYRLNVSRIDVPPLASRGQDIAELVEYFLAKFSPDGAPAMTREALDCLLSYHWPGNVRELKNLVESLLVMHTGGDIDFCDLPLEIQGGEVTVTQNRERDRLLSALAETNWNKSLAAKRLNCSRMTLYRKLAKYQLSRQDSKHDLNDDWCNTG